MAISRYKLYETVFDETQSRNIKGFMREDMKDYLTTATYTTIQIPIELDCRPDLIAYHYYGNGELFWILVFVNDIYDSPEGFYAGRYINIPDLNKLRDKL
jgi:hypothetical protein